MSFALGLLVCVWVNLVCDPARQCLVWPVVIVAATLLLVRAPGARLASAEAGGAPGVGKDADGPGRPAWQGRRPALPNALLALNGAFVMFLVGNFPNVFHMTLFSESMALRGMASGVLVGLCDALCLVALAATAALGAALAGILAARRPHLEAVVVLAVLVLVAVSVTVPTFSSAPVPVLTAVAFCMLALSLLLAWGGDPERTGCSMPWLGAGMLAGAVGGLVHIAMPLGQVGTRQVVVFGVMIAFVAADAVLLFQARGLVARLYFPELAADGAAEGGHGASGGAAGDTGREARCRRIARERGLTPRETDVLVLLAEGRDGPYIQDALGISRNTFKTHALHIHQKLGVGSQQDIIDLARGRDGGGQAGDGVP